MQNCVVQMETFDKFGEVEVHNLKILEEIDGLQNLSTYSLEALHVTGYCKS